MKRSLPGTLLVLGIVIGGGAESAYANADPDVTQAVANIAYFDSKTHVGLDGNIRMLWDLNPNSPDPSSSATYSGSILWILDSQGRFLAAGTPTIPASVGYGLQPGGQAETKSNIILQGQKSGNTTLVFLFGPPTQNTPTSTSTSFGVWTYNAVGTLISAAVYGPFVDTVIQDIRFGPTGQFTVVWANQSGGFYGGATGSVSAWTLNEFGGIVTAAGPFGPYANTSLGRVDLGPDNLQRWYWVSPINQIESSPDVNLLGTSPATAAIWTFNAAGQVTNSVQYGPF